MHQSPGYEIYAFEVAIFAILFLPALATCALHARQSLRNLPAWFLLFVAVVLQLAGSAIIFTFYNETAKSGTTIENGLILMEVVLIPLLLSIYGIIQQALRQTNTATSAFLYGPIPSAVYAVLLFIALVMHSWALGVRNSRTYGAMLNFTEVQNVYQAALVLEFLAWFYLLPLNVLALLKWRHASPGAKKLLVATIVSVLFLGMFVIDHIIVVFSPVSPARYAITTSLPGSVIMVVLPGVIAPIALVVAGLWQSWGGDSVQYTHNKEEKAEEPAELAVLAQEATV